MLHPCSRVLGYLNLYGTPDSTIFFDMILTRRFVQWNPITQSYSSLLGVNIRRGGIGFGKPIEASHGSTVRISKNWYVLPLTFTKRVLY